jgi:hypothetical protein
VRSCWGGMTAFEAKWFQDQTRFTNTAPKETNESETPTSPETSLLRFRFEEEPFWEASECCLIHADLQYRRSGTAFPQDSGIYMNPYIRVAYDTKTLSWLSFTRRPERLYSVIHDILNHAMGFPLYNPRQYEEPGQHVTDTEWQYDDPVKAFLPNATAAELAGQYRQVERNAQLGGYCGGRFLLVINETPDQRASGAKSKLLRPRDDESVRKRLPWRLLFRFLYHLSARYPTLTHHRDSIGDDWYYLFLCVITCIAGAFHGLGEASYESKNVLPWTYGRRSTGRRDYQHEVE